MRLLLTGIVCVVLFFPMYWALHPFLGPKWGAGISAFMMYLGLPSLFLLKWDGPSTNRIIKACNYGLALAVLGFLGFVAHRTVNGDAPWPQAAGLFFIYGGLAIYFLKHGYMPYQAEEMEARNDV